MNLAKMAARIGPVLSVKGFADEDNSQDKVMHVLSALWQLQETIDIVM